MRSSVPRASLAVGAGIDRHSRLAAILLMALVSGFASAQSESDSYGGRIFVNGGPLERGRVLLYPPAWCSDDASRPVATCDLASGGLFVVRRPTEYWGAGMRNWVRAEVRGADDGAIDYTYLRLSGEAPEVPLDLRRSPPVEVRVELPGVEGGPFDIELVIESRARKSALAAATGNTASGPFNLRIAPHIDVAEEVDDVAVVINVQQAQFTLTFPGMSSAIQVLRSGLSIDAGAIASKQIRIPVTVEREACERIGIVRDGRLSSLDRMVEVRDGLALCVVSSGPTVVHGLTAGGRTLLGVLRQGEVTWFPARGPRLHARQFCFRNRSSRAPVGDVSAMLAEILDDARPYSWIHTGLGPTDERGSFEVAVDPGSALEIVSFRQFGNHVARSAFRVPAGEAPIEIRLPDVRHLLFDPTLREDIESAYDALSRIHVFLRPDNDRGWSRHVLDADSQHGWSLLDCGDAKEMECVVAADNLFGRCSIELVDGESTYVLRPVLEPCNTVVVECDALASPKRGAMIGLPGTEAPWARCALVAGRTATLWDPRGDATKVTIRGEDGEEVGVWPIGETGVVRVIER